MALAAAPSGGAPLHVNAPHAAPAPVPDVRSRPSTCSQYPCEDSAPITWYENYPYGSGQYFGLPSRDGGECIEFDGYYPYNSCSFYGTNGNYGNFYGENCPGYINGQPGVQPNGNLCYLGYQTFPIYFATQPGSGNVYAGTYTFQNAGDDCSSLYLNGNPSMDPNGPYNGLIFGCFAGPSGWNSWSGSSTTFHGFSYFHVAYAESNGGPAALSYWFYTNGASFLSPNGVGPGSTPTLFPQAAIYGAGEPRGTQGNPGETPQAHASFVEMRSFEIRSPDHP